MKDEDMSSLFFSSFSVRYHRHVRFRHCDCHLRLHRAARDGVLLRFPASHPPAPQDQPRMRCYPLGVQVCLEVTCAHLRRAGTYMYFLAFQTISAPRHGSLHFGGVGGIQKGRLGVGSSGM